MGFILPMFYFTKVFWVSFVMIPICAFRRYQRNVSGQQSTVVMKGRFFRASSCTISIKYCTFLQGEQMIRFQHNMGWGKRKKLFKSQETSKNCGANHSKVAGSLLTFGVCPITFIVLAIPLSHSYLEQHSGDEVWDWQVQFARPIYIWAA